MNNPAAKEPSMDEILSSIRQIIADDDDASAAPLSDEVDDSPAEVLAEDMGFDVPEEEDIPDLVLTEADEEEAPFELELSSEQIVDEEEAPIADDVENFDVPEITEDLAEDIAEAISDGENEDFSLPEMVVPDDISFDESPVALSEPEIEEPPVPMAAPEEPVAAAQMPDPSLSDDIADQLLEPATDAAVKGAFAKLGSMALGANNLTIENMIREMLRPMLKEWLDENLPTVVEQMVEKEIERLARGG